MLNDTQRAKVQLIMDSAGCSVQDALKTWAALYRDHIAKELQESFDRGYEKGFKVTMDNAKSYRIMDNAKSYRIIDPGRN